MGVTLLGQARRERKMLQVLDSNRARTKWRDVLDKAHSRVDVVIERYGQPVAAVIAYDDYVAIRDELDDLRAARRAAAVYEAWKRNPEIARPYTEFRAELVAEGVLDNVDNREPLDNTPDEGC
jgi:PHD/YefM family antitoxin component YafN of YafNO toxin-antitoxin module